MDEVGNYLSFLENVSKEGILNFGQTEKTINDYLHKYYTIYSNEELKELIGRINNIQLLPEEKFRLLNFKPKSEIEISLLIDKMEEKLTQEDIDCLLNLFQAYQKK